MSSFHYVIIDSLNQYKILSDSIKVILPDSIHIFQSRKTDEFIFLGLTWTQLSQTFLSPFLFFALGLFAGWITVRLREYNRIKNLSSFCYLWIVTTVKELKKQNVNYQNFENALRAFDKSGMEFKREIVDIDRILNIPNEDLYATFISWRRGNEKELKENFYKIISELNYCNISTERSLHDYENDFAKEFTTRSQTIIDSMIELKKVHDTFLKNIQEINICKSYYENYCKITFTLKNKENKEYFYSLQDLLSKQVELFREIENKLAKEITQGFNELHLLNALTAFNRYIKYLEDYSIFINRKNNDLKESLIEIESCITKIYSNGIKFF